MFCKLQSNFGFFCSVNYLSRPLRKYMVTWTSSKGHGLWFVIGGFRFVWFVSMFQSWLLVNILFWAISTSLLQRFFQYFLFLSFARIKRFLPPFLDKNSTHDRDFLCHSLFCFWGPSWASMLKHCDLHYPAPTKIIDRKRKTQNR